MCGFSDWVEELLEQHIDVVSGIPKMTRAQMFQMLADLSRS